MIPTKFLTLNSAEVLFSRVPCKITGVTKMLPLNTHPIDILRMTEIITFT